jgi:hypothetical protein
MNVTALGHTFVLLVVLHAPVLTATNAALTLNATRVIVVQTIFATFRLEDCDDL